MTGPRDRIRDRLQPFDPVEVRGRAERFVAPDTRQIDVAMSEADVRAIAHELEVHRVELEMQNEELQRAFAERDEAAERYAELYDYAPIGLLTLDERGTVFEVNLTAAKLLGATRSHVVGRRFPALVGEESVPAVAAFFADVVLGRGGCSCELTPYHKDGAPSWLVLAGHRADSPGGHHGSIQATLTDISDRRRVEMALSESQELLRQANKMESIGRLAGGVAHDSNNMLTPIIGYAQLLLDDTPEHDPRRADLEEILQAAERARDLNRSLLAFARRQTLEMRPVELNVVVNDLETLLVQSLRDDMTLQLHLSPVSMVVKGDSGQLAQVLLNLVLNAQDAMPDGGVISVETGGAVVDEDSVEAHRGMALGGYAVLSVTDTGCGIAPEAMEHIFEPFFTSKVQGKGVGLGLASVYGIAEQHGGDVLAYSEVGRGSTFKVFLPPTERVPSSALHHTPALPAGGTETVLVAEDRDEVRNLAVRVLRRLGYTVLQADTGAAALRVAAGHDAPIHLLLTDVVMPEMGGKELAECLRKALPDVKVIFMSGYADETFGPRSVLEDGTEFIQKPFSIVELATKVRAVLDG